MTRFQKKSELKNLHRAFEKFLGQVEEGFQKCSDPWSILTNRDYHNSADRQTAAILASMFLLKHGASHRWSECVAPSINSVTGRLPYLSHETEHVPPKITFREIVAPQPVKLRGFKKSR